jgi:hypothetical protein
VKKIASLVAASVCLLALLPSATGAGTQSGWASYDWPALMAKSSPEVTVVAVPVDPTAAKVPDILAGAWPQYEQALGAVRSAITRDPGLKAALDAKGVAPDKVIGITQANGRLAVLVSEA